MIKIIATLSLCLVLISASAQIKVPAASTTQTVKQEFGLSTVELSYSRPNVKKRKIFGDLVPYNKLWRTGANAATTLTFGDAVTIGGISVPAGKYGLLSIPGKKNWQLIISKQTTINNPNDYKQDMDVVRVTVDIEKQKHALETFSIGFETVKNTSMEVVIAWDKSEVRLPITTDIDARIMANIDENIHSAKPSYFQAAMYYMDNGKDLNQALDWFNKAVEAQPDAFNIQHQWANCLAKLGKKTEAKAAATRSRELALKAGNNDYVKLNDQLLKELDK